MSGKSRITRRLAGVAVAGVCAAAALASPALAGNGNGNGNGNGPGNGKGNPNGPTLDIQVLSFNDFHGNLEAPSGSSGRVQVGPTSADTVNAGGVEYLATHLKKARVGHKNTVTVAAGDLIGASPLLSAAFHDEPSIEAMNTLGLDVSAVGNHEFDEGYKELQRMQNGGCLDDGDGENNQNSCPDGTFSGASFSYLAANVIEDATGETVLPAYTIKKFNGAKVAFIGMTLEATPNIVTAAGVKGLTFKDEVETANKLVPALKKKGVNAIVVLIHEGGYPASNKPYDFACAQGGEISGPIVDIAKNLDPAIDMVISGHTHSPYVCDIPDPAGQPRLVTSASSFGRLYTETNLKYDRRTNDIVRSSVNGSNMIVTRDVAKDSAQTELINRYKELVKAIASKVLGKITTDVTRTQNAAGESALGDLIADAQLADPSVVTGGQKPVIAFMNPGGIRADLTYNSSPYGEAPGDVVYEEAFTVQPFNNYLVSLNMSGQQIYDVLNQQFQGANAAAPKVLQINKEFAYTYSGNAVVDGSVTLNGTPISKTATYRVVTNNFLADGGDGFAAFKAASAGGVFYGGLDIDAFANYLSANSPYTPGPLTRITKQ